MLDMERLRADIEEYNEILQPAYAHAIVEKHGVSDTVSGLISLLKQQALPDYYIWLFVGDGCIGVDSSIGGKFRQAVLKSDLIEMLKVDIEAPHFMKRHRACTTLRKVGATKLLPYLEQRLCTEAAHDPCLMPLLFDTCCSLGMKKGAQNKYLKMLVDSECFYLRWMAVDVFQGQYSDKSLMRSWHELLTDSEGVVKLSAIKRDEFEASVSMISKATEGRPLTEDLVFNGDSDNDTTHYYKICFDAFTNFLVQRLGELQREDYDMRVLSEVYADFKRRFGSLSSE